MKSMKYVFSEFEDLTKIYLLFYFSLKVIYSTNKMFKHSNLVIIHEKPDYEHILNY